MKGRPTASRCEAVLLCRIRIPRPDAYGNQPHVPAAFHDGPAVGVVAGAGVALNGENRAADNARHDPHVFCLFAAAGEIEKYDVSRPKAAGDDLPF